MAKNTEWTDTEIGTLWRMLKQGRTNAEIANAVGRTERATATKILTLGWTRGKGRPAYSHLKGSEFAPDGRPPSPEQEWAEAWKLAHGDRRYADFTFRFEGYHRTTRSYGADAMTMGGVGPYG